ncbi:MAG: methylated-DNA--[protein]-cysteine S-methyltransferase [Thermoanaerobaculia bacterium]
MNARDRAPAEVWAEAWAVLPCPLGALLAVARDGALVRLSFADSPEEARTRAREELDEPGDPTGARLAAGTAREDPGAAPLPELARQLEEYFAGRRRRFEMPLAPEGTEFQRRVWEELARIPWGETRSYGEIARAVGRPGGSRAVGMANNRNPIAVVVPCHRVIGAEGSLTGYGAGLDRKEHLLRLEGALPPTA